MNDRLEELEKNSAVAWAAHAKLIDDEVSPEFIESAQRDALSCDFLCMEELKRLEDGGCQHANTASEPVMGLLDDHVARAYCWDCLEELG